MRSNIKKFTVIVVAVLVILVVVVAISIVELPLPDAEKGSKYMEATVSTCTINRMGIGFSGGYSATVRFSDDPQEMLLNFKSTKLMEIESICDLKKKVKINYHANKLLVRPRITKVIDEIKSIENR